MRSRCRKAELFSYSDGYQDENTAIIVDPTAPLVNKIFIAVLYAKISFFLNRIQVYMQYLCSNPILSVRFECDCSTSV